MRIAIIDKIHPSLSEILTTAGHQCIALHHLERDELHRSLIGMDGIVVRSKKLGPAQLSHSSGLRFIGRVGSGVENIDTAFCEKNGILLLSAPEGNRDGVGEMCVAYTLMLLKGITKANDQVHKGIWLREENRGHDLEGRTVGIIGFGNMGSSFASKLQGFGVRILAYDKYKKGFGTSEVEECELNMLFSESDVISLHLPLTDKTRHYADASFFHQIPKPVYFLNTSRGGIVDTTALLDAIDNGNVLGAALDVVEFERSDLSGLDPTILPNVQHRLFASDRILLTPHIAGVTHEGARKMATILAKKIIDAFPIAKN